MVTTTDDGIAGLADEYWDTRLEASPRTATLLGDRRFDDRIEDLGAAADDALRARFEALRARVDAVDPSGLPPQTRLTQGLLRAELRRDIDDLAARRIELASDRMDGVHAGLLLEMSQLNAPTAEAAGALATRHRQLGTMLDQAVERFRAGLAAGRTPARLTIERSLNQLDGYLSSSLDEDPFVTFAGPPDWPGEADWREELTGITRDVIRPAFARYRQALATELLPAARPDDRCGLSWLGADGEELYAGLVRQHTTVDDLDVADVHQLGLAELDRLAGEYEEVGTRIFGTGDRAVIFDRLRNDPALRYAGSDEILADARRCLDAAGEAMGGWFGRLPATPCGIEVIPDHLAADAPAAYYWPPAGDGSRPGAFLVNLWQPTERTRHETASVAFHEGIPGHHLQLAIASELDHLPRFQRFSWGNTAFVEGWALYAERLADEMGLYRDDLDRAGLLANDSWRSARLVVDTGLHALGWSRQHAIDFMVANVPVGRQEIEVEVDRYVAIPGQALGYKIGQLEIQRLRRETAEREGAAFDIRSFHDRVLGSGSVNLMTLRELAGH
jgi:uncharacterized protein (DUF885 family)